MNSLKDASSDSTTESINQTKDEAAMADTWRLVCDAELDVYQARRRHHAAERSLRVAEDLYFLNPKPAFSDLSVIEAARKELDKSRTLYREANAAVKTARQMYLKGVEIFRSRYGREPDIRNYTSRLLTDEMGD